MKKSRFFIVLGVMLLLFTATAWASQDTPAILASLDQTAVTQLDDSAIAEIRGQALYKMVKLFPLNFLDYSPNPEVLWTWNPLEWKYGNWGGAGYGSGTPVDGMDYCFKLHDASGDNAALFAALLTLPDTYSRVWGCIYGPTSYDVAPSTDGPDDAHFGYIVKVSRISILSAGGRFFWGWKSMPLTEYARRQAATAMGVLSLLP